MLSSSWVSGKRQDRVHFDSSWTGWPNPPRPARRGSIATTATVRPASAAGTPANLNRNHHLHLRLRAATDRRGALARPLGNPMGLCRHGLWRGAGANLRLPPYIPNSMLSGSSGPRADDACVASTPDPAMRTRDAGPKSLRRQRSDLSEHQITFACKLI
jgi:hypothetical protein